MGTWHRHRHRDLTSLPRCLRDARVKGKYWLRTLKTKFSVQMRFISLRGQRAGNKRHRQEIEDEEGEGNKGERAEIFV